MDSCEITNIKYAGIRPVKLPNGNTINLGTLIFSVSINESKPVQTVGYFRPAYESSVLKYIGKITWVKTENQNDEHKNTDQPQGQAKESPADNAADMLIPTPNQDNTPESTSEIVDKTPSGEQNPGGKGWK